LSRPKIIKTNFFNKILIERLIEEVSLDFPTFQEYLESLVKKGYFPLSILDYNRSRKHKRNLSMEFL